MTTPSELRMALIRVEASKVVDTGWLTRWQNAVEDLLHLIVERLEPAGVMAVEGKTAMQTLVNAALLREARASCALDGQTQSCQEPAAGGDEVQQRATGNPEPSSPPFRWRCERCGLERQSHVSVATTYGSVILICQKAIYVPGNDR